MLHASDARVAGSEHVRGKTRPPGYGSLSADILRLADGLRMDSGTVYDGGSSLISMVVVFLFLEDM